MQASLIPPGSRVAAAEVKFGLQSISEGYRRERERGQILVAWFTTITGASSAVALLQSTKAPFPSKIAQALCDQLYSSVSEWLANVSTCIQFVLDFVVYVRHNLNALFLSLHTYSMIIHVRLTLLSYWGSHHIRLCIYLPCWVPLPEEHTNSKGAGKRKNLERSAKEVGIEKGS